MKSSAHVMITNLYRSRITIYISVCAISNTVHPNQPIIQSAQRTVASIFWQKRAVPSWHKPVSPDELTSIVKKSIFKAALELGNKDIALRMLGTEQEIFEGAAGLKVDEEFGKIFNFGMIAYDNRDNTKEQQPTARSIIWDEIDEIQTIINQPRGSQTAGGKEDWHTQYQTALKERRYFDDYQLKRQHEQKAPYKRSGGQSISDAEILAAIEKKHKSYKKELLAKKYLEPRTADDTIILPATQYIASLIKKLEAVLLRQKAQAQEDQRILRKIAEISSRPIFNKYDQQLRTNAINANRQRILKFFTCLSQTEQQEFRKQDDQRVREVSAIINQPAQPVYLGVESPIDKVVSLLSQIIDDEKYKKTLYEWNNPSSGPEVQEAIFGKEEW